MTRASGSRSDRCPARSRGGRGCDVDAHVNHFDRQPPPEIVNELNRFVTPPCRTNKTLRERRSCHREPVPLIERLRDRYEARDLVMRIVAVQEPDQHARIEMNQRHSSRSRRVPPPRRYQ